MLKDATGFNHVYIAAGKTDLRKGQDGLLMIIKNEFEITKRLIAAEQTTS